MILEPIEAYVRSGGEPLTDGCSMLRGSPLTAVKFAEHAARTARAYSYGEQPCFGVSVELSRTDGETQRLLAGRRLSTRRQIALIDVRAALDLGFVLLPTFTDPHWTVVVGRASGATIDAFAELAHAQVIDNPYYRGGREV